jgi:hypothetical protein
MPQHTDADSVTSAFFQVQREYAGRRGRVVQGHVSPKPWVEFARDSPLEGSGFELSVPRQVGKDFEPSPG